jgi:hypothetical protein
MKHHPAPQVRLGFAFQRHPTPKAWLRRALSVRRQDERSRWSFWCAYWKYSSPTSISITSSMTGMK